jgi:dTDP-4-dehydrorhamnose 3,5-epimerase
MRFTECEIDGVVVVELEPIVDERGWFARSWCAREVADHGLNARLVQCNLSHNKEAGTLRGLHYQTQPFQEAKLVRCVAGAMFDVAVDLRAGSSTYRKYFGIELRSSSNSMLYVPEGCAHGFITLVPETQILYLMSEFYEPSHSAGIRWDDPAIGIDWPRSVTVISERDRNYPDLHAR